MHDVCAQAVASELLGVECSHPGGVEGDRSRVAGSRTLGSIADRYVAGRFDLDFIRPAPNLLRDRAQLAYRPCEATKRDHRRQPSISMTRSELDTLCIERCDPYGDVFALRFEAQLESAAHLEQ